MESKEQLLDLISKVAKDRALYLTCLFQYIPEVIVRDMTYVEIKKNENLVVSGDPCDKVFILLKGSVTGFAYQKTGRMYSFMDFSRMHIVGDFELFSDSSEYRVTVCAVQDCKLLRISAENYLRWIRHDENALALRLDDILKTLTLERKIDREYLTMGCRERLVHFLIMLYEKNSRNLPDKYRVEMTQSELANKIGFNIRSVQRNVAALEGEKLISNENGKIVISREQYLKLKREDE